MLVKDGEKSSSCSRPGDAGESEQRKRLESDEREGLVREYLETLLPEDWDAWICSTAAPSSPE